MKTTDVFVIVGAGLAGAKAAEALRAEGFTGRLVLIGEESARPYDRISLSKDYLQDKWERDKVFVHPAGFYDAQQIELRLGTHVTSLDPAAHRLSLDSGEQLTFDRLLLATGSTPRRLDLPGAGLDGVCYLRGLDDCEALKARFATARRAVIIGAGWIGLETAAAARAAGVEVSLLERSELPLAGVLGPELAEIYAALHTRHGVQLRTAAQVSEILGLQGRAVGVRLADGGRIDADVVVVGVGIAPNTDLAATAGLCVANGIVVDEHLASSVPDIFAAGDVADVYYPSVGRRLRLEHWSAALTQGPVAAANMVGRPVAYDEVPYFFSDQYDMGMEFHGHVAPGEYDRVVFRGEVDTGAFIAFWLGGGAVTAAMNVNIWDQGEAIAALVRSRRAIDPDRLADPRIALEELLGSAGVTVATERTAAPRRVSRREQLKVAVATAHDVRLLASIRAIDDRLDVTFELEQAEVLFGWPEDRAEGLRQIVRANPGLCWIQATTGDADRQLAAAELTEDELARVLITGATVGQAGPPAEFALLGLLAFTNDVPRLLAGSRHMQKGPVGELAGRTLLVVGLGPIGREVARLARAFGMTVLGVNRTGRADVPGLDMVRTARFFGDLLPRAHGIVLALPQTAQTHGLIGAREFGKMRTGAIVVNIGGGGVVDEDALVRALDDGSLAGAALDSVAAETLAAGSPLWVMPNVLVRERTVAVSAQESERVLALFAENLRRYLRGDELLDRIHLDSR